MEEITLSQLITKTLAPKKILVNAERSTFINIFLKVTEEVIEYIILLKQALKYCEYEKLGSENQSVEEDLIQMKSVNGLQMEEY